MSSQDKSKEKILTRDDIHEATKNGTQDYSKAVNAVNAKLAEHKVPVPTQAFAEKVITNAKKVEDGDLYSSTAFAHEVPHLVKHGVTQLVTGMVKGARAKGDYNTGKAFGKELDTGSTNTGLGLLSMTGAITVTSASMIAAASQNSSYKTGTAMPSWGKKAVEDQQQQEQQQAFGLNKKA